MFVYTIKDVALVVIIVTVIILLAVFWLANMIKQRLCKHDLFYTPQVGQQALHDICRNCGKDLGFCGRGEK